MILGRARSEQEALERFFSLLDEHRTRRPHLVAKLLGIRDSDPRKCDDLTDSVALPPSLSLVTYTEDPGFFVLSDTDDGLPAPKFYPCIDRFEASVANRERLTVVDPCWNYGIRSDNVSGK